MLRLCFSILLLSATALTQANPLNDPNAVITQAATAFSSRPLRSVYLEGTARAYAGSDQPTGSFTYQVAATGESTLQLDFGGQSRTETTGAFGGCQCKWLDSTGTPHKVAPHNCALSLSPIVPLLGLVPQLVSLTKAVGTGMDKNGGPTTTITLHRPSPGDSADVQALLLRVSKAQINLDPQTHLPESLNYATHPDNNANIDIAIEIRYSDYRQVDAAYIPFHIQKFLNNGLSLDLQVDNATVQ